MNNAPGMNTCSSGMMQASVPLEVHSGLRLPAWFATPPPDLAQQCVWCVDLSWIRKEGRRLGRDQMLMIAPIEYGSDGALEYPLISGTMSSGAMAEAAASAHVAYRDTLDQDTAAALGRAYVQPAGGQENGSLHPCLRIPLERRLALQAQACAGLDDLQRLSLEPSTPARHIDADTWKTHTARLPGIIWTLNDVHRLRLVYVPDVVHAVRAAMLARSSVQPCPEGTCSDACCGPFVRAMVSLRALGNTWKGDQSVACWRNVAAFAHALQALVRGAAAWWEARLAGRVTARTFPALVGVHAETAPPAWAVELRRHPKGTDTMCVELDAALRDSPASALAWKVVCALGSWNAIRLRMVHLFASNARLTCDGLSHLLCEIVDNWNA